MTHSKHNSISVLLLFVAFFNATCQSPNSDKGKQFVNNPVLFSRSFVDSIPQPNGSVNQYRTIYTSDQVKVIDSLISDFEKKTTIQIAIISFDTSMFERDSIEAVTLKVARYWGIGQKDKNNGIVIGICTGYRIMTIRNGYGIEKILSDTETKDIIDSAFIPGFKEGDYFEGTIKGLNTLMKILTKKTNSMGD